jgi:cytochrome b6-f complex iron-sulfur subunit
LRYLSYAPRTLSPTEFDLGPAEKFPPGSRTVIAEAHAVVLNIDSGFAALSLICPHLGCQVNLNAEGFACPCHGSRFDVNGHNLRGPADRALRELKLTATPDGHLLLNVE